MSRVVARGEIDLLVGQNRPGVSIVNETPRSVLRGCGGRRVEFIRLRMGELVTQLGMEQIGVAACAVLRFGQIQPPSRN